MRLGVICEPTATAYYRAIFPMRALEHKPDLERIPIAYALKRLLEIHPELRVLTVGVPLPLHSDRYEHVEEVDFLDLLKMTSRMDIGIAPLADTAFNRCRSNVKLKEYGSGAPPGSLPRSDRTEG